MSNQYVQSQPGSLQAPRAGTLPTVLRQRMARIGQVIWQALEASGRSRADREMLALADHWQDSNPTLARELRSYVRGGSSY
jgi:hypothetical protein